MSVSILDGQLTRTWKFELEKRQQVITLYHDTITGVRSVMLNYEEVSGSMGNSSLVMESAGHVIPFRLNAEWNGYVAINRSGFFGFEYSCVVNGQSLKEITSELKNVEKDVFKANVLETINAPDEEHNGAMVLWYVVEVTRLEDGLATQVHRRFRDFAEMNSQIKQNLKGHHLLGSLPPMPEKTLKILVDHSDPAFIQDRIDGLNHFLRMIINLPHVSDMTCVRGFLGVMDRVVEYSTVFFTPTMGLTLDAPSTVGSVQNPDLCPGVRAGDSISKVNGVAVAGLNFNGVVARLKFLPRPLVVHFVGFLGLDGTRLGPQTKSATYRGGPSPTETDPAPVSAAKAAAPAPAPASIQEKEKEKKVAVPVVHSNHHSSGPDSGLNHRVPVVQAPAPAPVPVQSKPLAQDYNKVSSTFLSPDKLSAFEDVSISPSPSPTTFSRGPGQAVPVPVKAVPVPVPVVKSPVIVETVETVKTKTAVPAPGPVPGPVSESGPVPGPVPAPSPVPVVTTTTSASEADNNNNNNNNSSSMDASVAQTINGSVDQAVDDLFMTLEDESV